MKKTLTIALSLFVCFGCVTGGVFADLKQNDKVPSTVIRQKEKGKTAQESGKPDKIDKGQKEKETSQGSKSKVVKEELEEKKKERAEARLEAKDYIKELKELFQGADNETKKEI